MSKMDSGLRRSFDDLRSADREVQGQAYQRLLTLTAQPVDWVYEVWDELVAALAHPDNRLRSIAAQLLCQLAQSDTEARMVRRFPQLLAVTKDEKFVTARHALQSLWRIGLAGQRPRELLLAGLAQRFAGCQDEKNGTLIRYDISQSLRRLYDAAPDEELRELALRLIETETDDKYRRKYAAVWK